MSRSAIVLVGGVAALLTGFGVPAGAAARDGVVHGSVERGGHAVGGSCFFRTSSVGGVQVVTFGGHAVASGHPAPVTTSVTCTVTAGGVSWSSTTTAPGAAAATAGTGVTPLAPVTICMSAKALWSDGDTASFGPLCF